MYGSPEKTPKKDKSRGILISRLSYCLEVVSTGRKKDMEKMQGVQSAAARWVSQTKKRDWHLKSGLKKLEWLSMCQQAVYVSLKTAMKVLRDKKPERLYKTLVEEIRGELTRKVLDEKKVSKMKASTKKAWSIRSLRWMAQMPEELIEKNIALKSTKEELKKWIRATVPVKGDRILWGQKLTGDMRRNKKRGRSETVGDSEGNDREDGEGDRANSNVFEQEEVEREVEQEEIEQEEAGQEEGGQENDEQEKEETRKKALESKDNLKKRLKKSLIQKSSKLGKMMERRDTTGPVGWVPGNLPRANEEPPNPGKGGSLSPQAMRRNQSGDIFIQWCSNPLTLVSCMSLRLHPTLDIIRGDQQKKQYEEELIVMSMIGGKEKDWPKDGIG